MVVGRPGSSVLVFVPGMGEIVAITELVGSSSLFLGPLHLFSDSW
jgi:hypothetical protein